MRIKLHIEQFQQFMDDALHRSKALASSVWEFLSRHFRDTLDKAHALLSKRDGTTISRPTPNTRVEPRAPQPSTSAASLLAADTELAETIYAIGDIHGRAELLRALMSKIEADVEETASEARLIFLGDYCDRGLETKAVIDFLLDKRVQSLQPSFLKGNHEETLLAFLSDPKQGPVWAQYGGRETLISYGVRPPRSLSFNEEWIEASDQLQANLPEDHETFFRSLKSSMRVGPYGFAHAGMRPGIPFDQQDERDLLWIRDEFLKSTQDLDVMLIHGHTPVDEAVVGHNRVNVDTGAYYSGCLTAARIDGNSISFISTRP